jgi:hypothetical protein
MAKYTIASVDWNTKQTELWLHHIKKNCHDYEILLIPEKRRFENCWSSPKLYCFDRAVETEWFVYLDTDTIVTRDLAELFEDMGDSEVGVSVYLGADKRMRAYVGNDRKAIEKYFALSKPVVHVPTGIVALKGLSPSVVYREWCSIFDMIDTKWPELSKRAGTKIYGWSNEVSFSFWLSWRYQDCWDKVYDIGKPLHYYLLSRNKELKKMEQLPMILHYHSRHVRLKQAGLGHLLEEVES